MERKPWMKKGAPVMMNLPYTQQAAYSGKASITKVVTDEKSSNIRFLVCKFNGMGKSVTLRPTCIRPLETVVNWELFETRKPEAHTPLLVYWETHWGQRVFKTGIQLQDNGRLYDTDTTQYFNFLPRMIWAYWPDFNTK